MGTAVLYHAHCPDGFGAALACWLKFGDTATYIPVSYGDPPPYDQINDDELYIVDFSYEPTQLGALASSRYVTVIDHHKTAQEQLMRFYHDRVTIIFDLNESGATLTWKTLFDEDIPLFFQYLRDRDLWLWEMEDSKEISAAVRSYPHNFSTWETFLDPKLLGVLVTQGAALMRQVNQHTKALARNAIIESIGGYDVPCVNTPLYGSEIGNYLCQETHEVMPEGYPFAACFSLQKDGRWRWELRSIGDFDVSEVAKMYGGGGHKNAAGFLTEIFLIQ